MEGPILCNNSLRVTKTRYYTREVEPSPSMFVVAQACVLKETSGHFHPCLWQPKLDIFPRKYGHVKQFSWQQQQFFWRGPHDIHSCLYDDKSGCFEGNLGTFPVVFVVTGTGILRQSMMFSYPQASVFVPKPNQSINTALSQERNRKCNLNKHKVATYSLNLYVQKCTFKLPNYSCFRLYHPRCGAGPSKADPGHSLLIDSLGRQLWDCERVTLALMC